VFRYDNGNKITLDAFMKEAGTANIAN